MKKTVTINLGGLIFNIDEDAFAKLKSYLDTIKGYFSESEGRDEIMTDIESRIAEMLQEKLGENREVVTIGDIDYIISVMGQPEDYISDDLDDEPKTETYTKSKSYTRKKRLYRDPDDRVMGGVCSGIGHYFGTDPVWIRLGFALAFVFFGTGILLYIILWIVIPEAKTPSEKLQMKGEPVTFDTIGRTVEEEIENVKSKFSEYKDSGKAAQHERKVKNAFHRFTSFLGDIFRGFFKVLGKLLGIAFVILAIIVLVSLIIGLISPFAQINFDSDAEFIAYSLSEMTQIFFTSSVHSVSAIIGIGLLIGIPFLALLYAGLSLILNIKNKPKGIGLGLASAWILGIILTSYAALATIGDFSKESSSVTVQTMDTIAIDTLYIEAVNLQNTKHQQKHFTNDYFKIIDNQVILGEVDVDILEAPGNKIQIEVIKSSRGRTYKQADKRAENIRYTYELKGNKLRLNPYLSIDADDKWRNQQVKINILLPKNQEVFLAGNLKYMLNDVKNITNTRDWRMVNHYWNMSDSGFVSDEMLYPLDEKIKDANSMHLEIVTEEDSIRLDIK